MVSLCKLQGIRSGMANKLISGAKEETEGGGGGSSSPNEHNMVDLAQSRTFNQPFLRTKRPVMKTKREHDKIRDKDFFFFLPSRDFRLNGLFVGLFSKR
jgi:hypothetical protein